MEACAICKECEKETYPINAPVSGHQVLLACPHCGNLERIPWGVWVIRRTHGPTRPGCRNGLVMS